MLYLEAFQTKHCMTKIALRQPACAVAMIYIETETLAFIPNLSVSVLGASQRG